jgi:hypothetical protein
MQETTQSTPRGREQADRQRRVRQSVGLIGNGTVGEHAARPETACPKKSQRKSFERCSGRISTEPKRRRRAHRAWGSGGSGLAD